MNIYNIKDVNLKTTHEKCGLYFNSNKYSKNMYFRIFYQYNIEEFLKLL